MADSKQRTREALKLSEEQFRRAIEEAPIPTIMQAEDGQVLQLSRSWTALTGYELGDMPTFDNWVTSVVFDGAENVRNHMHELFKGNKNSINVEFTVRTSSKGIRDWSFSASSPGTLLDGRRFIIGMAVDVTERKKIEEALRVSEQKYRLLFNSIDEGFCIIEMVFDSNNKPIDYRFIEVNSVFERQTGLHDAVDKLMRSMAPSHEEHWFRIYGEIALSGIPKRFENEAKALNRYYDVYAFPIGEQKPYRVGILFKDISERKKAEEAVARIASFPIHNPDPIVEADFEGKITYLNPVAKRTLIDIAARGSSHPFLVDWQNVVKTFKTKSDSILSREVAVFDRWYLQTIHLVSDGAGECLRVYSVDITERKKAEDALMESEERLKMAQQVAHVGTFEWNIQTGVNKWTPELEAMYGLPVGGFSGTQDAWEQLVYPEDRNEAVKRVSEAIDKGSFEAEFRVAWPDGSIHWMLGRGWVFRDSEGKPLRLIGINLDITERKKAEQAFRESESKYRLIVDTAEEGIWVATPDGKATFVNQKMADLLGYPKEDILGKDGLEFLEKPQASDVLRNRKILDDKGKVQTECKFIKKDGSILWTIANTAAIFDNQGKHVANIAMHTNITKRKKAEEILKNSEQAAVKYANELQALHGKLEIKTAETEQYATKMESLAKDRAKQLQDSERLAAIGATAGMVGHDIRNPLQAITGEIYLVNCSLSELSDSRQKTEMKESMDSITANVSYINKIVADLQDYARPLKPEYSLFDLTELIEDILRTIVIPDNIKRLIDGKSIPAIKSDQTYLRRSITNLVNNAIQAMPEGGTLTLKCHANGDKVLVSISDTGVGIPEHVKAKLFTPMMTTKAKGQGLGLAVVKRLIEALNGSITFESQEGKGTRFIIELPTNMSA